MHYLNLRWKFITEPVSIQDLYQTPVLGSALGYFLENASMYLLNRGTWYASLFGHILNPATLFWFYKGRIEMDPVIDKNKFAGFRLTFNFLNKK